MRDEKFPTLGDGSFLLGVDSEGMPVALSAADIRRHVLVSGDLSDATESVVLSLVESAIANGSGAIYMQGMGDVASFARIHSTACRYGREDDVLVLNFMTSNVDLGPSSDRVLSNTFNPLATGSPDSVTEMIVQLMDDTGGDSAMWKTRITTFLSALMRSLTWMRDEWDFPLNVGSVRDHLNLRSVIDLAYGEVYAKMPTSHRDALKAYLRSLPGFREERGQAQSQTTLDHHGYLDMQVTKTIGSLADVYGHIFFTPSGEIDMADVIGNGRILIAMLPAIEKSVDDGKILPSVVAHLIREGMRSRAEGAIDATWEEATVSCGSVATNPFLVVLDEVGYRTIDSLATIGAQARSLGFGIVVSTSGEQEIRKKTDALDGLATSVRVRYGSDSIEVTGADGKVRIGFMREFSEPTERIRFREGCDLTWSPDKSSRFHTRSERRLEFLGLVDGDCDDAFSFEPLVLGDVIAALPDGSARTRIQQSFALVGGYRKIAALKDQEQNPLADLYYVGGDHP